MMINEIYSQMLSAINDYSLISEGDKILIGVSGGKDSLSLLALLNEFKLRSKINFEMFACHIRTDFHCASCMYTGVLSEIFEKSGIKYIFKDINVLDESGKTDCFWCSWNKRKALFRISSELNCSKIALGHHKNDIVETVLMNLFFHGQISAMCPRQELFKGKITIIRPLCYIEEELTSRFAKECGFPTKFCRCSFGRNSVRKYTKELISALQRRSPGLDVSANIFKSIEGLREKSEKADCDESIVCE